MIRIRLIIVSTPDHSDEATSLLTKCGKISPNWLNSSHDWCSKSQSGAFSHPQTSHEPFGCGCCRGTAPGELFAFLSPIWSAFRATFWVTRIFDSCSHAPMNKILSKVQLGLRYRVLMVELSYKNLCLAVAFFRSILTGKPSSYLIFMFVRSLDLIFDTINGPVVIVKL